MDNIFPRSRFQLWTLRLVRAVTWALAAIGFGWLVGGPILRLLLTPAYNRQVTKRVYSPHRAAVSQVEVTSGGFGTVWTTRVRVGPTDQDGWIVYQARDSIFTPALTWKSDDTLVIGLSCDRFDYLSNPDDFRDSNRTERRLEVHFEYLRLCDNRTDAIVKRRR